MYAKFPEVQIKEARLKDEADREKRRREKEKLKQAAATGVHEVNRGRFRPRRHDGERRHRGRR